MNAGIAIVTRGCMGIILARLSCNVDAGAKDQRPTDRRERVEGLSPHEGADREVFLDNERVRYAAQLQRYGALMRMLDAREIRLGLYFPLLGGWREWRFEG